MVKLQRKGASQMRQKNERKAVIAAVFFLVFIPLAYAETVQLDLFSVGCPSLFDPNHYWSSDIDLGVQFSQIDSVYIDWAGEITGGLAVDYNDPENPYPMDVKIGSYFESAPDWRHVSVWGGSLTYPNPEPFDNLSEFIYGSMPWSELYDGQVKISIEYGRAIMLNGTYVEDGFVTLTDATLEVEGTVVPEPSTILLLTAGIFIARRKSFKKSHLFY
jgi:hypothetical protein